jgi:hypothetical protein
MKNYVLKTAGLMTLALILACVSCGKKKAAPEITNLTALNHDDNTTIIPRGGIISVNFEAESMSKDKLDYYHIEIHDHPASGLVADEYKIIDESFKNKPTFKGLKNANVHEHVTVPMDANLGKYHVVITVVDEYGNSADTEDVNIEITIVE